MPRIWHALGMLSTCPARLIPIPLLLGQRLSTSGTTKCKARTPQCATPQFHIIATPLIEGGELRGTLLTELNYSFDPHSSGVRIEIAACSK